MRKICLLFLFFFVSVFDLCALAPGRANAQALPSFRTISGEAYAIAENGVAYGYVTRRPLPPGTLARWASANGESYGVSILPKTGGFANGAGVFIAIPFTHLTGEPDLQLFDNGALTSLGAGTIRGLAEDGTFALLPAGESLWQIRRWVSGSNTLVDTLPSGHLVAVVTSNGSVYGNTSAPVDGHNNFVYKNGALSYFGGNPLSIHDANDAGVIVGMIGLRGGDPRFGLVGYNQPFIYKSGETTLLSPAQLGVDTSFSRTAPEYKSIRNLRINNAGQIVGTLITTRIWSDSIFGTFVYWNVAEPELMQVLNLDTSINATGDSAVYGLTDSGLALLFTREADAEPTFVVDVSSLAIPEAEITPAPTQNPSCGCTNPTPTPTPTSTLTATPTSTATPISGDSGEASSSDPTPTPTPKPNIDVAVLKKPKVIQLGKKVQVVCPLFAGATYTVVLENGRLSTLKSSRRNRMKTRSLKPGKYTVRCEYTISDSTVAVSKAKRFTMPEGD